MTSLHEAGSQGQRDTALGSKLARVWGVVRLGVAILIAAAVVATVVEAAGRTSINIFNLFGYFTIQSNLLLGLLLAVLGVINVTGRPQPPWMESVRAACLTYIVLVGLVYAVLLAPLGAAGGVPVLWANVVLHIVTPLFAVVDWVVAPERSALGMRTVGLVMIYPVLWLVVGLVRGATDGWVPYPFLDPENGYGQGTVTVVVIAIGVLLFAWLVVLSSRRRVGRHRAVQPGA